MSEGRPQGPGGEIPSGASPYKKTPEFSEESIPAGLLKEHSTKAGVWGVITILSGSLRYVIPETGVDAILEPDRPGIVLPEQVHFIEAIGPVRFFVEFWRLGG